MTISAIRKFPWAAMALCMAAGLGAARAEDGARKVGEPDYTSRVPKFTFARTLAEQEAQLKTNPLMLRFAESRKRLAADRYRPMYHFVKGT